MSSTASLNNRNFQLDLLKGIAIIAVVLYHAGLMQYGYLGVDVFLVVSGYLTAKSILISRQQHDFRYWEYIRSRLVRIWPLALVITIVCFVGGYFTMLPVPFKNVSETTVGTSFLVNNFVQYVVSSNYWDYSNDFKPLMHTWYIGLLFQFYLIYPLLFVGNKKIGRHPLSHYLFTLVFALSLILFLLPVMTTAQKFYLLPARLFEFCAGGMIVLWNNEQSEKDGRKFEMVVLALLLILLFVPNDLDIASIRLLLTVSGTAFFIAYCTQISVSAGWDKRIVLRGVAYCGMASYSLYLWHQVIFAFYRYVINEEIPPSSMCILLILCILAGVLSYKLLEQSLSEWMGKEVKKQNMMISTCLLAALLVSVPSIYFYDHKGVVRDVPELDISYLSPTENQNYNERINTYDVPFENNDRKNILVIGDSYARDWFNVLLESHIDTLMNISYHRAVDVELMKRIEQSDYVFIATCTPMLTEYAKVLPMLQNKAWWRVGTKNFGRGMGRIYNNDRYDAAYYDQIVKVREEDIALNEEEKHLYEHNYIELMEVIKNNNGMTPAFTPTKKFISHDGLHLTQAGARYFAQILNIGNLLRRE